MKHNLFTHPTEVTVEFDDEGNYCLENLIESQNIMDVLEEMNYNRNYIDNILKDLIEKSNLISKEEKRNFQSKLNFYLSGNSYLKTIQANKC